MSSSRRRLSLIFNTLTLQMPVARAAKSHHPVICFCYVLNCNMVPPHAQRKGGGQIFFHVPTQDRGQVLNCEFATLILFRPSNAGRSLSSLGLRACGPAPTWSLGSALGSARNSVADSSVVAIVPLQRWRGCLLHRRPLSALSTTAPRCRRTETLAATFTKEGVRF